MANEKFKVKFGLAVGDTAATIDAASGDIVTTGDLDVKGANITNSTGGLTIATTSNGNLTLDPDGTGKVIIAGDLQVDGTTTTVNSTTLDVDDINITLAKGAVNAAAANGGGITLEGPATAATLTYASADDSWNFNKKTAATELQVDNININGNTISTTDFNGNLTLAPNVNGDVILDADTVQIEQKLTTIGANNLILNTNNGTNSGEITIGQGLNANINITPSGTGNVAITKVDIDSGAIDGTVIGANSATTATFTTVGATTGNITTVNATDVDTTSIEVTNIKAKDGTAAATVANTTGAVSITTELTVDNLNINGNTIISTNANGNITLTPNSNSSTTCGNVALSFSNGGNLTNTRNYVYGGIRNATTQGIGDIWALNSTGPSVPMRGISIDNSVDTTKNAGLVLRQGNNTGAAPARIIFERSRGSVGAPTAIQSGDSLGLLNYTGYTSTGWLNDNIAAVSPGNINITATENWVSNTNLGTNFAVSLAPSAIPILNASYLIPVISHNPQSATYRADAFTFQQGKTGTTNLLTLGTTSSTLKAKNITFQDTSNAINNVLVTAGDPAGATFNDRVAQIRQFSAITTTGEASTMTFQSARYNTGTAQYSPTQSGDEIGTFFFNGNYNTGATTAVNGPTARFGAKATETWTVSANGGRFYVETINTGTTTSTERLSLSNTEARIKSDDIYLQTASGTSLMEVNNTRILNNRPHRSAVTTVSIARGSTYTPAAGVNNFIELTLTAGTDPTYIDVDNLTVAGEGGHVAILVYNNSGSAVGNNDLVIRNNGTTINSTTDTIANGARVIFTIYCIGNYASCEYMNAA